MAFVSAVLLYVRLAGGPGGAGRGALLDSIKAGKTLKKTPPAGSGDGPGGGPQARKQSAPQLTGMAAMMAEMTSGGRKLAKSVGSKSPR